MNQMLAGAAAGLVLAPVAFAFTRWALAPYRKRRDQLRATPTPSAADWAAKLAAQDRAAQIVLRDDQLILNNDRLPQQPFALSQLRNVSIVTRATPGSLRSSLEFRGQRTLVVPALAQGVPVLLAWLRTQPGFDEPAWNRVLAATKTERATVLRRPQAVNARWLQGVPDALALVLLRPSGDIPVSWDILYADLRRLPGVELLPDSYGTPQLRLGPARIGSLALDELWVRGKVPRDDVPVRAWSSSTVLEPDGRERNYRQLRDFFDALAGPQQRGSYDRADAAQWVGSNDGIEVRLVYWHDSDYAPESGYCSLQMTNARPYPRFLTDPYCASLRPEDIDSTLLGLHGVFVEQDFRRLRLGPRHATRARAALPARRRRVPRLARPPTRPHRLRQPSARRHPRPRPGGSARARQRHPRTRRRLLRPADRRPSRRKGTGSHRRVPRPGPLRRPAPASHRPDDRTPPGVPRRLR